MVRSLLPFAALSLLAVACTQPSAGDDASSADEINAASGTPECAEDGSVDGVSLFRDAQRSNVFYAVPDAWSIDPITAATPYLEDVNSGNPWVDASEKLSPLHGLHETTFRLSARTRTPLEAVRAKIAAAHPELANVEVRLLPLDKAGEPEVTIMNVGDDGMKVDIESTATTLDVKVTHDRMSGKNELLTFIANKATPIVLSVPTSFACMGPERFRKVHLNGSGASLAYPGAGITVTNEASALDGAVTVVNFAEVFMSSWDALPEGDRPSAATAKALRDGLDAALRPVLTAKPEALRTSALTRKASEAAVAVIKAFQAKHPVSGAHVLDATDLLERAEALGEYEFHAGIEPFRK